MSAARKIAALQVGLLAVAAHASAASPAPTPRPAASAAPSTAPAGVPSTSAVAGRLQLVLLRVGGPTSAGRA
jgi:hypothetical protein